MATLLESRGNIQAFAIQFQSRNFIYFAYKLELTHKWKLPQITTEDHIHPSKWMIVVLQNMFEAQIYLLD